MSNMIQELKAAVDKTAAEAASAVDGRKSGVAAAFAIIGGVIDQNLVVAEYWRIALRDVQRIVGAAADRTREVPSAVKRSQVNIAP